VLLDTLANRYQAFGPSITHAKNRLDTTQNPVETLLLPGVLILAVSADLMTEIPLSTCICSTLAHCRENQDLSAAMAAS
jgi:hypothetical protein